MRKCAACGADLVGKRPQAKFCSDRCKVRSSRGQVTAPAAVRPEPTPDEATVQSAVRAELRDVGRLDTTLGRAAVVLAARIDLGIDTGSAMAALAKQLQSTLEAATADAKQKATPLETAQDELAKRRKIA